VELLRKVFAAKKNPTVLAGCFFRAKFHSNSLYVVEKKIVGISQYPYFRRGLKCYSQFLQRTSLCLLGGATRD
jgi:hypothetical protein